MEIVKDGKMFIEAKPPLHHKFSLNQGCEDQKDVYLLPDGVSIHNCTLPVC